MGREEFDLSIINLLSISDNSPREICFPYRFIEDAILLCIIINSISIEIAHQKVLNNFPLTSVGRYRNGHN